MTETIVIIAIPVIALVVTIVVVIRDELKTQKQQETMIRGVTMHVEIYTLIVKTFKSGNPSQELNYKVNTYSKDFSKLKDARNKMKEKIEEFKTLYSTTYEDNITVLLDNDDHKIFASVSSDNNSMTCQELFIKYGLLNYENPWSRVL